MFRNNKKVVRIYKIVSRNLLTYNYQNKIRTRADLPSSNRDNRHASHNVNALKDLQYNIQLKKKREKEKNNNNIVRSDDEKDNRATCKKCPTKLPNNSDEYL